ncbi:MAG: hypothetical protein CMF72_18235 [Mameliella sp.]|nr:hypothetical protein [Mameliella sp.]
MQVIVNSMIYASQIAVIALGVSMCYSILRFTNFAQIQYAVVGGYLLYVLSALLGLPILPAAILAMAGTGLLAVAIDILVFAKMREATAESKMIASWGVALFIRSVIAAIFGGSALYIETNISLLPLSGVFITSLDIFVVLASLGSMVVLHLALVRTRLGTALRAMSSNLGLSRARGIPTEAMIRLMWFIVGAFAAMGGILVALQTQLTPNMDLSILLPVFAAVAIGGMSNIFGAVAGAFLLSFTQNVLIAIDFGSLLGGNPWYLPAQFKDLVAVTALVIVLMANLQGRLARWGKATA